MGHDLHDHSSDADCWRYYILHGKFDSTIACQLVLTFCQLFVAWMAGARFDIAYYQFKQQMGELLGYGSSNATKAVEVTSKIVEAVPAHTEL